MGRWLPRLLAGLGVAVTACHAPASNHEMAPRQDWSTVACDTTAPQRANRRAGGVLSPAERDSLVREVRARRVVWRARHIMDYRIRVAAGCFCPWPSTPAVLEVRNGLAVTLRDTTGRPAGPLREPWSPYTVEGLFDAVERAARSVDVVEVGYDACLGYPSTIRGDSKLGLPDDWFWVTAGPVMIPRR